MERKPMSTTLHDRHPAPRNRIRRATLAAALVLPALLTAGANAACPPQEAQAHLQVTLSPAIATAPVTGRLFLFVVQSADVEPRLQRRPGPALFGTDVDRLAPGTAAVIDTATPGYPVQSLAAFPAGDYVIQALLNVYTEFHRTDGHVIWAHMDQWEGQRFTVSPGNLYSAPLKIHWDPAAGLDCRLTLDRVIPPIPLPEDTPWVKHIKIKSELLSRFWGHPFYLGATVLLPKGYVDHPDLFYPVEYEQTHFSLDPAHGFDTEPRPETEAERARRLRNSDETGYEFYQQWIAEDFPRMICVVLQHPTPYYDDSYAVNSANNGPFGDAIMTELIPAVESRFRIIREPWARVLSGGSTGGWEALALQVYHPDFFGGAWVFFPDPVDFRRYGILNIYEDENAFTLRDGPYRTLERPMSRTNDGQTTSTFREQSCYESVLGSRARSGEQLAIWEAVYGPVAADGYPQPLWDPRTGRIDHAVAEYMREHGYDLRYFLEEHWAELGPKLKGKLHIFCGDMDNLYLNLGVYLLQDFLEKSDHPPYAGSFQYGRPLKGHGWRPMNNYQLVRTMGDSILHHRPAGH